MPIEIEDQTRQLPLLIEQMPDLAKVQPIFLE